MITVNNVNVKREGDREVKEEYCECLDSIEFSIWSPVLLQKQRGCSGKSGWVIWSLYIFWREVLI